MIINQAFQFMKIIICVMEAALASDHCMGMKEPGRVEPLSLSGSKTQQRLVARRAGQIYGAEHNGGRQV